MSDRSLQPPATAAVPRSVGLLAACFALVGLVAIADYLTGYEIRLAILYLVPIALLSALGLARAARRRRMTPIVRATAPGGRALEARAEG